MLLLELLPHLLHQLLPRLPLLRLLLEVLLQVAGMWNTCRPHSRSRCRSASGVPRQLYSDVAHPSFYLHVMPAEVHLQWQAPPASWQVSSGGELLQ